jgi:hypothetical protein
MMENDPVDHPDHYTRDEAIECIDAIQASMRVDQYEGFLRGQVMRYIWRFKLKGHPTQDLRKAQWYLARLIELLEGTPSDG